METDMSQTATQADLQKVNSEQRADFHAAIDKSIAANRADRADRAEMRAEMRAEVKAGRAEMRTEMRAEVRAEIKADRAEMRAEMARGFESVRGELAEIRKDTDKLQERISRPRKDYGLLNGPVGMEMVFYSALLTILGVLSIALIHAVL